MSPPEAIPSTHSFWSLPVDASRHGPALDQHLLLNLWIALGLVLLLHILLISGVLFRHRTPRPIHKLTLEYLPLLGLCALFGWLGLRAQHLWAAQRYTGADPAAMQVEVTGMQFVWYFRYPGPDATFGRTDLALANPGGGNPLGIIAKDPASRDDLVTGQLVLPAGREVDLTLRAQDVIHGFAIPEMRLKQNAVPGQDTHIHFTPEIPGTYAILCTQVCGLGHYRMQAALRVLPAPDFDRWLAQHESKTTAQLTSLPPLDRQLASPPTRHLDRTNHQNPVISTAAVHPRVVISTGGEAGVERPAVPPEAPPNSLATLSPSGVAQ